MKRRVRCRPISYKRHLWPWFTITAAESRQEQDIKQSSSNKEWRELDRMTSNQLGITEVILLWQGMNSILQMFNVRSDCSEFWNAIEPVPAPVYHSVFLLLKRSNPNLSILIILTLFQGERYFERTILPIKAVNCKPTCKRRAFLGCKKEVKEKIKPSEERLLWLLKMIEIGCLVLYGSPSRRELDRIVLHI